MKLKPLGSRTTLRGLSSPTMRRMPSSFGVLGSRGIGRGTIANPGRLSNRACSSTHCCDVDCD